ncbi:MAG: hypothetical protein IK012_06315 [Fibrobacter sp.]|uniref:hypothetical protein n=1 Tax=Fibrobacter sp. TaxID=35828 RepID=UPI0025B7EBF6|nr:hypothetical protein [Fibrobacter sp.]MBR4784852.1 hypothetical protein [Fibrobacter sp.]
MNLSRIIAFFCVTGILAGCASMPRELSDHKEIPGGEYTGTAENNRPEEIKYQKLPDNIQYVRASDSLVVATYDKLKAALATDETVLEIADYLFLMPGTWEKIASTGQNETFNKRKNTYTFDAGKEKFKFLYAIPKTDKSARKAWEAVKREIRRPAIYTAEPGSEEANALGSISIRAISTQEMETIVWFSPFKMVEPIFIVNDKYLLGFNKKGKLEVLDEIPYYLPFYEKLKVILIEREQQKQQMSPQR